jgi:cell division transport system permease protein
MSALGIATIAFSLFALGLFGLVRAQPAPGAGARRGARRGRAFAVDSTPPAVLAAAADVVRGYPEVAAVRVVTSEEALQQARRELGEFRDVFDDALLPASLDVQLREGSATRRACARW